MSKTASLFSALFCTLIWGTTFIAQDTGMDDIGPFTFNAVRFFVGFLVVAPLAFIFERKNILKSVNKNQKQFTYLAILIGLPYSTQMSPMQHFLLFFMCPWSQL